MNSIENASEPKMTFKGLVIALSIGVLILLILSEIILRIAMPQWDEFHSGRFMQALQVPEYGTVAIGRPGFDGGFAQNNGDFRTRVRINDFGLRNDAPIEAADNKVWVIGDSMTFGWGVEIEEYYGAQLQTASGLPTYNVASPGTDPCGYQALVARMPQSVKPAGVVVGLVIENDILQTSCSEKYAGATTPAEPSEVAENRAESIKQFLSANLALYNFFTVSLKRVDVVRVLLMQAGLIAEPHKYRISIPEDRAEQGIVYTADALAGLQEMLPQDVPMMVLIVPGRFEIRDNDPLYRQIREGLKLALAERGVLYVDPFEDFAAAGFVNTHFAHDGHWSAEGHRIAGEALARWLVENNYLEQLSQRTSP
jgi:hypothetical protein